jgi:LysE type translocator
MPTGASHLLPWAQNDEELVMPALSTVALFLLAALGLLLIPGPSVLYIITRSVGQGRRAGLVSVSGVELASLTHVAAAALGLSALLMTSALAFSVVKYVGAGSEPTGTGTGSQEFLSAFCPGIPGEPAEPQNGALLLCLPAPICRPRQRGSDRTDSLAWCAVRAAGFLY